jgi:hypothetical protein
MHVCSVDTEPTEPLPTSEGWNFVVLHEAARQAIHSTEILHVSTETVEAMLQQHLSLLSDAPCLDHSHWNIYEIADSHTAKFLSAISLHNEISLIIGTSVVIVLLAPECSGYD